MSSCLSVKSPGWRLRGSECNFIPFKGIQEHVGVTGPFRTQCSISHLLLPLLPGPPRPPCVLLKRRDCHLIRLHFRNCACESRRARDRWESPKLRSRAKGKAVPLLPGPGSEGWGASDSSCSLHTQDIDARGGGTS